MSIEQATAAVDEAAQDEARERHRVLAFYRMLRATDNLLWKLEELNFEGVKELPLEAVRRMRKTLAELPVSVESAFIENVSVQEVLNGVFDVQDRLLAWGVPGYESGRDDEEGPCQEGDPKRQERILRRVHEAGKLTLTEIYKGFRTEEQDGVRAEVGLMVSTGVLSVDRCRSANGRMVKRYYLAGERP